MLAAMEVYTALTGTRRAVAFYALSLAASGFTAGLLLALFTALPMLVAIPVVRWIDRGGVRLPLLCGTGVLALGWVVAAALGGLAPLPATAVLVGLGYNTVNIAALHAIGTVTTACNRLSNFNRMSLSAVSFAGPVLWPVRRSLGAPRGPSWLLQAWRWRACCCWRFPSKKRPAAALRRGL